MIDLDDLMAVFPAAIQVPRDMRPPAPVLVLDFAQRAEPVRFREARTTPVGEVSGDELELVREQLDERRRRWPWCRRIGKIPRLRLDPRTGLKLPRKGRGR